MAYYMFKHCEESALEGIEAVMAGIDVHEARMPAHQRGWVMGKADVPPGEDAVSQSPVQVCRYDPGHEYPLFIQSNGDHRRRQDVKDVLRAVIEAVGATEVFDHSRDPYDMSEFS